MIDFNKYTGSQTKCTSHNRTLSKGVSKPKKRLKLTTENIIFLKIIGLLK